MEDAEETFVELTVDLDFQMIVVTACREGDLAGCLVGFSTQCSIRPPRYLVCLSDKNRTARIAMESEALAVHFLGTEDMELAHLFGEETTDEVDKFSHCHWHPGPSGVPILDRCERWFVGRIIERHVLGDHVGYVLEPIQAHSTGPQAGLFFQQVKDFDPGHAP